MKNNYLLSIIFTFFASTVASAATFYLENNGTAKFGTLLDVKVAAGSAPYIYGNSSQDTKQLVQNAAFGKN